MPAVQSCLLQQLLVSYGKREKAVSEKHSSLLNAVFELCNYKNEESNTKITKKMILIKASSFTKSQRDSR